MERKEARKRGRKVVTRRMEEGEKGGMNLWLCWDVGGWLSRNGRIPAVAVCWEAVDGAWGLLSRGGERLLPGRAGPCGTYPGSSVSSQGTGEWELGCL